MHVFGKNICKDRDMVCMKKSSKEDSIKQSIYQTQYIRSDYDNLANCKRSKSVK